MAFLRTQSCSPGAQPQAQTVPAGDAETVVDVPPAVVERSVLVQHGIHSGHFPVSGLRVRDARQTLTQLLNIDPQAVAVIGGRIVPEDTVIGEDVSLLSFVKPSAVKG
jgi:hypothetical protein